MYDKDIPLDDRIWRALERTCRLHTPRGHCAACDERWAAIMLAISPERDLLQRHDAIVDTVVRDRIIESRRAERYRLAWLSARQGRAAWERLYLWAVDGPEDRQGLRFLNLARKHARALLKANAELSDYRLAFSEMEGQRAAEDRPAP